MARRQPAGLPPAKVALIHVARRQLGMNEDDYRALLLRVTGVSSARDLTEGKFRQLMEVFAMLGFQSDSAKTNLGRRPGMATPGHIAAIRALWSEYTDGQGTEQQLGKLLEKTWHVSALRFLPAEMGPKVILALRAMCARRKKASHDAA